MLSSPAIVAMLLLLACLVILLLRKDRPGPAFSLSTIARAPLIRPRSTVHWCVNILWWAITARWMYFMFVQPLVDPAIRQEYRAIPAGLLGAWLLLLLLYLPYLIAYLWAVTHLSERDRGKLA